MLEGGRFDDCSPYFFELLPVADVINGARRTKTEISRLFKDNEEYNVFIMNDYCTNENTLGGIHQWPSALDFAEFRSNSFDVALESKYEEL
jgi:hypothetical protein